MKRLAVFAALLAVSAGFFASLAPASADAHKDRFRYDCNSGARKC